MPDLSVEATRVLLMAEAGCDARCGLTISLTRDSQPVLLRHHRRDRAIGKSEHTEIATVAVADDLDVAAWISEQHPEDDDA